MSSGSASRVFLDWTAPALPAAASWLVDRAQTAVDGIPATDLSGWVCITPGPRAGRLLVGELLAAASSRNRALVPPAMTTPGPMVDQIVPDPRPKALPLEVRLAWMAALRRGRWSERLAARPGDDDSESWAGLAETIAAAHDELAGQMLDFEQVAERAAAIERFSEAERYTELAELRRVYDEMLARCGLVDPHRGRAGFDESADVPTVRIALIGVTELNRIQREALRLHGDRVTALVHAPESMSDRFDELGCVRRGAWTGQRIDLDDDRIVIADRPPDQARALLGAIAAIDPPPAPDEIVIALADRALEPAVRDHALWASVPTHGSDIPLERCSPALALAGLGAWISTRGALELAELLRHVDVERWIRKQLGDTHKHSPITVLDEHLNTHMHFDLGQTPPAESDTAAAVMATATAVDSLTAELNGDAQPLGTWMQPLADILRQLYGGIELDGDRPLDVEACTTLLDVMESTTRVARGLQPEVDRVTAIRLVLRAAADQQIERPLADDQIELLSWRQLHLDTAPNAVLGGVNDGTLPAVVESDPLLPDSMRRDLGLPCNESRYDQDAYRIQAIASSRGLTIVAGRQTIEGDQLTPSRLLLACDETTLLDRFERLCGDRREGAASTIGLRAGSTAILEVPMLPALDSPSKMSVTAFGRFLRCPYRFALERLLKLESIHDREREMAPMTFGSLAHAVLEQFGLDETARAETDPQRIREHLHRLLDAQVARDLPNVPTVAVLVQLARLRERLDAFAECQALLRADGWEVRYCECEFPEDSALVVDGEPMCISGKVDRIDCNPQRKRWRLIDYKTGDNGKHPHKTHHGSNGRGAPPADAAWKDLQLPLYRHFMERADLGIGGGIEVGYINLDKTNVVEFHRAEWGPEHYEAAMRCAADVIRQVRDVAAGKLDARELIDGDIEPKWDEFARICRSTAMVGGSDEDGS